MKKTDKILVTGASGFIGSRLIKMLYEDGFTNLRATSWSRDLRNDFEGCENVEFLKGDCSKAQKQLGWKHQYTFESMLDEMIDYWFNNQNKL